MARATVDFGIDLGTTNSAIAVLTGVLPEIVKNNRDQDITPSAVSISKKGELHIGLAAKNKLIGHPDDVVTEFKRLMGSDHLYTFESSGQKRKPEELSAEILKSLTGDIQQRKGESIEAAVVTVPAAFELNQCDATRRAAELAGLKQNFLLLEPVAAALAYGFQADTKKSYWLVFDFGGGTFDAALIKSEEGTIQLVNHGGDNFLGGSDIDWALVEKVIVPKITQQYRLKDFTRANAGKGGRWRQAFARLKAAAEQAKIDLSRKDRVTLDPDYAGNIKDESTGEIVIDEVDLEISQSELIQVAEPFIARAIEITKRVLLEKKLNDSAIERLILVGGPTIAPYFRDALNEGLRVRLDHSIDPLTAVARGAAVFAATQRLSIKKAATPQIGVFQIELKYQTVGPESAPIVMGKIKGRAAADLKGWTIEFVNQRSQWRSGKISVREDGFFRTNLHAERGDRNLFLVELRDSSGRRQKTDPEELSYTIGVGIDEQPLIHSIGVALANNEWAKFFEKGHGLPQKATRTLKSIEALRQGLSGDLLRIPIVEGDNELADRNRKVGELPITGEKIPRDLPAGSDIEVTLEIDVRHRITVSVYVPLLDQDFPAYSIDLGRVEADAAFLREDFDAEMRRFRETKRQAVGARGETAAALLQDVERSPLLLSVKEELAAAPGDHVAAAKCEKLLLELKLKLDEAANAVEWPALVAEANQFLDDLRALATERGNDRQRKRTLELADELKSAIAEKRGDRVRRISGNIQNVYYEILLAQPDFWVGAFNQLTTQRSQMKDSQRADRLFNHARDCIAKNNSLGLQNVVRELWELLPRELAEKAKRGYGSGVG